MTELRPREDAAVKADQGDPFRFPARPSERFQGFFPSAQVLDHGSPNGPLSPRLRFCQIGPRRQRSGALLHALDCSGPIREPRSAYEGKRESQRRGGIANG